MAPAKPEQKVKEQKVKFEKLEPVKREPKNEAKVKAEVKPGTNTKLLEELAERGRDLRAKNEKAKREVKQERGKAKAKPRRKQRVTAKRRNSSRESMNKPVKLTAEMSDFLGETALSRPEVQKRIWAYAKEKNLQSPSNKKQIICDRKLRELLNTETTTCLQLSGQIMRHLDYSVPVNPETEKSVKRQRKSEAKAEAKKEEKKELLKDEKVSVKAKSSKAEAKKETSEASTKPSAARAEAVAQSILLRFSGLLQQTVNVEFTTSALDLDKLKFEFVAIPGKPATNELRRSCNPGAREDGEGNFESFGEGKLDGLAANAAYSVFVELEAAGQKCRSMELTIPQRARPEKWTPHEVQLWAATLRVPEFTKKLVEYRVDGATLLTLGEADLRGLGLTAPFLLRRVVDALKVISSWSL